MMEFGGTRSEVFARLQARRGEMEEAIAVRAHSILELSDSADPEYVQGLSTAVSAALDYGLAAIQLGEERAPPVPPALLAQARLAARNNVSLDAVLRRYFAGYALLSDYLIEEAEQGGLLQATALQRLARTQSAIFDRLLTTISAEYSQEMERRQGSAEQRRADHVKRLLAGELLDSSELNYVLEGHHLGVIGAGPGAADAIRDLAATLDRRLLLVPRDEGSVWAWLGGRRPLDPEEFAGIVLEDLPAEVSLAVGESGEDLSGWRLTHQQAQAALPIALRSPKPLVRYADVALLAALLQDHLLATSLRELYLAPLAEEPDGGEALRDTLRAYFAAERNASSAAAALGVDRHTVTNRLRAIEDRLGRPLGSCTTEIDAALRLEDLGYPLLPYTAFARG